MQKKLHIVHVITRMIIGGAQENTLLSCIRQHHHGHKVTLITGPTVGPEGKLLETEDTEGVEIIEFPHLIRELNPYYDLMAYVELKKWFKQNKPDVVHTHSSKAGILARRAAWKAHVPVVVHTVHGQAFHAYEKAWKNWIYIHAEKMSAKYCHKIYAVAQAMIEQCVKQKVAKREKYQVVYSGMRLETFINAKKDSVLKEKLKIPNNAVVIGTVARLFPLKGYEQFIPAAISAVQKNPNLHYLLVGNGILYDSIQQQVQQAKLSDHFHFAGLVQPVEIPNYIALMDGLVHFSLREGLPRGVVQALAAGKPAIGFNLDGTPEVIIDGQTGYILEPNDSIEKMSETILKIANNPEKSIEMGKNGRNLVSQKFDWQQMGDILLNSYFEILQQNKTHSAE